MKTEPHKLFRILSFIFIFFILTTACSGSAERQSKPSEDWSRSVSVGKFVTGSIGIAVSGAGERINLIWPSNLGEGPFLRYVQLDQQAKPIIEKDLEFSGLLRASRLVSGESGDLHLFWASRPPGGKYWTIWHVMLDAKGDPSNTPKQISAPDVNVGSYVVVSDQKGGVLISWASDAPGDVFVQHLDQNGEAVNKPTLITNKGESPSIWVDVNEKVYYAWKETNSILYAHATIGSLSPEKSTVIGEISQGTGKSMEGPYIGVSEKWVYVFWSLLNQSGLEEGTGYTAYTSFPVDAPINNPPSRILLSPDEVQPFESYQGRFKFTELVPPVKEAWASSDYVISPNIMQGKQSDELAVALAMNQARRLDQKLQIAIVVFRGGQFIGYTIGSKTENISDDPALFIDTENQLHLAWREGAGGNSVYYATTRPEASAALERLNAGDIINAIFQGGLEGIVGIAFLPVIGFGWLLPGMILIVIVKIVRDQDNLTNWKHFIPLIIAIILYYLTKFATLPTISTYVPFSAWVDIPERIGTLIRGIIPVLIFILAVVVADQVRRRKTQSAAVFYITFSLVDAILTLAIYGVNFLGVY